MPLDARHPSASDADLRARAPPATSLLPGIHLRPRALPNRNTRAGQWLRDLSIELPELLLPGEPVCALRRRSFLSREQALRIPEDLPRVGALWRKSIRERLSGCKGRGQSEGKRFTLFVREGQFEDQDHSDPDQSGRRAAAGGNSAGAGSGIAVWQLEDECR